MRKIYLFLLAAAVGTASVNAQTVATFDDLTLPAVDTYYVNYATPGTDVGFNDGLAHFPCKYDTSFGGMWTTGFAYSSKTDSVTSGYTNEYAAKTAIGYAGSAKYASAYCSDPVTYLNNIKVNLIGAAIGKTVSGFMVTNSTYAYNSMKNGDAFAKKFGGTTGNDPDWFKLRVRGYLADSLMPDSVCFYLADYRFANNDSDYIVKTWQWVNLLPLGHVDSLQFSLSSTDNSSFGMNTPAYFCIDNFTTNETSVSVNSMSSAPLAKVYPNPASDRLFVEINNESFTNAVIIDMLGNTVLVNELSDHKAELNITALPSGNYVLHLFGSGKSARVKFVKK